MHRRFVPIIMALAISVTSVGAADLIVTRFDDPSPDGCEFFPLPDCSLREAVIAANASSGADTIHLLDGTYTLSQQGQGEDEAQTGDLDILHPLTVRGESRAGTSIDGNDRDRVFHVIGSVSATLEDLTITGGQPSGNGGGVLAGDGSLTLDNVRISGCNSGNFDQGGGIWTNGPLVIRDSLIDRNSAFESGAVEARGPIEISRSDFNSNTAEECGCLDLSGDGFVDDSSFMLNSTERFGGAVCTGGSLEIRHSSFDRNGCTDRSCFGGAIRNDGILEIEESYFHDNNSAGRGGGVFSVGQVIVRNSTFDGDTAIEGGVLHVSGDTTANLDHITATTNGFAFAGDNPEDRIVFRNSIVFAGCIDPVATINSLGGNIEGPSDTCGFGHPTDQTGVAALDLGLDPAADNGGPTLTKAIDPSSIAVGAAVDPCASTDQRGIPRPLRGPRCDSGAFEVLPDDVIVVTHTNDPAIDPCPSTSDCSLRGALIQASATPSTHDTIVVPRGTFLLTVAGANEDAGATGDLDPVGPVTVIGVGPSETIIDGNGLDRVLHGHPGGRSGLTLSKVAITGGSSSSDGGGISGTIVNLDRVEVWANQAQNSGGGVFASGDLSISASHIHHNLAAAGGGVSSTESTAITDSTLDGNEATQDGGGIHHPPGTNSLRVFNSTLADNDAGGQGGAIATYGPADLRHVTFAFNHADDVGDDVFASNAGAIQLLNNILSQGCAGVLATTFASLGGNVESPLDTCGLTHPADQASVPDEDLAFDDMGDHGGPTPTFSFLWRSVARDAAVTSVPAKGDPGIGCFPNDQRGFHRPVGIACDSGAYEHQGDLFGDGFETGNTTLWSSTFP